MQKISQDTTSIGSSFRKLTSLLNFFRITITAHFNLFVSFEFFSPRMLFLDAEIDVEKYSSCKQWEFRLFGKGVVQSKRTIIQYSLLLILQPLLIDSSTAIQQ